MGHQPFETWLLSGERLLPADERKLQDHLDSCESCQNLSTAWSEVDELFLRTDLEEPAPGFTMRWQARLANLKQAEQLNKQRLSTGLFLGLSAGAALVVLTVLIIQVLTTVQTPVQVFASGLSFLASLLTLASAVQVAFIPFLEVLLVNVPIYWWFVLAMAVSMCILLISFSFRYFLLPRRVSP